MSPASLSLRCYGKQLQAAFITCRPFGSHDFSVMEMIILWSAIYVRYQTFQLGHDYKIMERAAFFVNMGDRARRFQLGHDYKIMERPPLSPAMSLASSTFQLGHDYKIMERLTGAWSEIHYEDVSIGPRL